MFGILGLQLWPVAWGLRLSRGVNFEGVQGKGGAGGQGLGFRVQGGRQRGGEGGSRGETLTGAGLRCRQLVEPSRRTSDKSGLGPLWLLTLNPKP